MVSVTDYKETTTKELTLNVHDIIEREYTKYQFDLIDHMKFLLFGKALTSGTVDKMLKWKEPIKTLRRW